MARKRKRPPSKAARRRGYRFEARIGELLDSLVQKFPAVVKVRVQPKHYESWRQHRPDFELEYKLGGLLHGHLIECQDRDSHSYELADKIYAVRGTTNNNRYIFVYSSPSFAGTPQEARLKEMGVVVFDFNGFESFLHQLEADIALRELGRQTLEQALAPSKQPAAREKPSNSREQLLDSARKNNPRHEYQEDRAMLAK